MSLSSKLESIVQWGVRSEYQPWEKSLTRKINGLTLFACSNLLLAAIIFLFTGFPQFLIECSTGLILAPLVFYFNKKAHYISAAYMFYIIGFQMFFFFSLRTGLDSLSILLYFPLLISLIQLLGRKETFKHLLIIALILIISVLIILIGYSYDWLLIPLSSSKIYALKIINISMCFVCGAGLISVVSYESIKQEAQIKSIVKDKEILLAEVFHRVKNNMNIVTSLLNLKKDSSESEEVKQALEDCRNRVFSMALVHQKIYTGKNYNQINFKEYISDLVKETIYSFGSADQTELNINADEVCIRIQNAIPCGLIVNELITNAFKHAVSPDKKLKLDITLKLKPENLIELIIKDNGPGLDESKQFNAHSLGIDLIKSLTDQLDGNSYFTNDNGLRFTLRFKQ